MLNIKKPAKQIFFALETFQYYHVSKVSNKFLCVTLLTYF